MAEFKSEIYQDGDNVTELTATRSSLRWGDRWQGTIEQVEIILETPDDGKYSLNLKCRIAAQGEAGIRFSGAVEYDKNKKRLTTGLFNIEVDAKKLPDELLLEFGFEGTDVVYSQKIGLTERAGRLV